MTNNEIRLRLDLPSDLRLIEATVGFLEARCRSLAFHGPRLDLNFRIGVTEALANAVLYGNQGDPDKTVRVDLCVDTRQVIVEITDQGEGFDPSGVRDPTEPENIQLPGGRGLFLIRKLMDEIQFNEKGNALRMVLVRERPPERAVS